MNGGDERYRVEVCDCLAGMQSLAENSIDSIVTDPPYGLEFMGKAWDHGVPATQFWIEALRVAKPGAHLLAFGGTRTYHRLACAIEDAGWEIRDCVMWVYGSGFPKSMDVGKAIDKAAGAEREVVGMGAAQCEFFARGEPCRGHGNNNGRYNETVHAPITAPATDAARQWEGWGTALKPAYEPIIVARKPLCGTVAENVVKHGTGAINIDGCRVETKNTYSYPNGAGGNGFGVGREPDGTRTDTPEMHIGGRFPANLIHDGSDEVLGLFPWSKDGWSGGSDKIGMFAQGVKRTFPHMVYGSQGSAARFFYCAKASKADREVGLDDATAQMRNDGCKTEIDNPYQRGKVLRNHHPTVKPTALMRYLCKLVTQPNGVILDPFMGSGSTGKAAMLEGFRFIGMELNEEYANIARSRIANARETRASTESEPNLFEGMEKNDE